MNSRTARPVDANTFTLSLAGVSHTYPHNKEGKRQAILDGLHAIVPVTVGTATYLPSNAALQVVAAVLYPEGIRTEAAYQTVCQVTEKACAHLGYADEVTLGPPHVPFAARGAYRQRQPPVEAQFIRDALAQAGTSSAQPRQEVACALLWNKAGLAVYGQPWSQLTGTQQSLIQTQVDELTRRAGWEKEASADPESYTRPLPLDETAARRRLAEMLARENGHPVVASNVIYQAQLGAYGRRFYRDELPPALQAIVTEVLQAHGYRSTLQEGEYRPAPIPLTADMEADMAAQLAALTPVITDLGPCLLLRDVLALVQAHARVETVSDWQAAQLVREGAVSQALRQLGYKTELTWCRAYQFQPPLGDDRMHHVILKTVRVQNDPGRKLTLAKGFPVSTPAITIDDVDDTLVYLQMVGPKQSVRANWAALVGGGKVHWIGRKRVRLEGMKAHVKLQATLPCGWADHILIHKQASLQEINPEEPFYLLDDGAQRIPPLFYAMLNKCLALPLLPAWAAYLWQSGQEENLVTLLDDGEGQGYAAWRVMPASETWQEIIADGLARQQITF